jgi:hypothetical protein
VFIASFCYCIYEIIYGGTVYGAYRKNHPYQNQLWKERLDHLKASGLMNQIRENIKVNKKTGADEDMIVINAVDRAVEEMSRESLLKPFLNAHKAEVKGMLLTEYNEAEAMRLFELDGERRGRAEGEKKKTIEVA